MGLAPLLRPPRVAMRVWGDTDVVVLVSVGVAAELAVHPAVDWLVVTGGIPHDPLGRLIRTAESVQPIVFGEREAAERALARIREVHAEVERRRGAAIPDWAHRDVLDMLMDYSDRAMSLLERFSNPTERDDLWAFYRSLGARLDIEDLPTSYDAWCAERRDRLESRLAVSAHTRLFYTAYRHHLGKWRFALLRQIQALLVPEAVRLELGLPRRPWVRRAIPLYRPLTSLRCRGLVALALLPSRDFVAALSLDRDLA